jgi:hypothetical protein
VCEIIVVIANVATAVVLFPLLRRRHEGVSLGYVASRVVESTIIVVGIVSLLAVVLLGFQGSAPILAAPRRAAAGARPAAPAAA